MKKILLAILVTAVGFMIAVPAVQAQPRGPVGPYYAPGYGPEWQQQSEYYCPYCGKPTGPGYHRQRMYGYHHRGAPGYGYGPGMMQGYGRGGMMGPMYAPGYGPEWAQQQEKMEKLNEEQAKRLVNTHIEYTRNPNLKVGKIKEIEMGYEVEIVTKDDSLVDKVFVDKYTGWMRSVY